MTALPAPIPKESMLELRAGRRLSLGEKPLLMGVLNLTPDSFSDGGLYLDPERALDRALQMLDEGADILDLGAESTRPGGGVYGDGAQRVDESTELERLLPVLARLRRLTTAPLSIDTQKASVARAALDQGADMINDVSALGDPKMGLLVAESGAVVILMHSRGERRAMQRDIRFEDVVGEVRTELCESVETAVRSGIGRERILIDPGIGFGKTVEQNLELLRRLDVIAELGPPVVVGTSRKSFIGAIAGARETGSRLGGSLATAVWAAQHGAQILRGHDVAETAQCLRLWSCLQATEERTWAE